MNLSPDTVSNQFGHLRGGMAVALIIRMSKLILMIFVFVSFLAPNFSKAADYCKTCKATVYFECWVGHYEGWFPPKWVWDPPAKFSGSSKMTSKACIPIPQAKTPFGSCQQQLDPTWPGQETEKWLQEQACADALKWAKTKAQEYCAANGWEYVYRRDKTE